MGILFAMSLLGCFGLILGPLIVLCCFILKWIYRLCMWFLDIPNRKAKAIEALAEERILRWTTVWREENEDKESPVILEYCVPPVPDLWLPDDWDYCIKSVNSIYAVRLNAGDILKSLKKSKKYHLQENW